MKYLALHFSVLIESNQKHLCILVSEELFSILQSISHGWNNFFTFYNYYHYFHEKCSKSQTTFFSSTISNIHNLDLSCHTHIVVIHPHSLHIPLGKKLSSTQAASHELLCRSNSKDDTSPITTAFMCSSLGQLLSSPHILTVPLCNPQSQVAFESCTRWTSLRKNI